jgi:aminocarboxymuconate-semialdehyde decarboxylase
MTVIDVHAHLVPQEVVDILASRGRDFGIALVETEPGCHCCRFESGMQVRPFFEGLMNVDQRLSEMDRQGVDREVLSLWTDIFGYDLPAVKGGLWHAALNDSLARLCNEREARFSWLASGALQNPAGAARELERCMNAGAIGAIVAAMWQEKTLASARLMNTGPHVSNWAPRSSSTPRSRWRRCAPNASHSTRLSPTPTTRR